MSRLTNWLAGAAVLAGVLGALPAAAQTPVKFTLD